MKVSDFTIEPVPRSAIQSFVKMIGAMIYALPSMKSTAAKYNPDNPLRCWELRRLCCIDDTVFL